VLNRLTVAGFLSFTPSQGFFRKPFDATEVVDLYEMRQKTEVASVRLAVDRAFDEALKEVDEFLAMGARQSGDERVGRQVALDEQFHERIVKLSGNGEMLSSLFYERNS
jgi:DNA-binding GntR family transcriptional regulator